MIGHRTQPYRAGPPRMPGQALDMMLRGRLPGAPLDPATMMRLTRQAAPQGNLEQLIARRLQQLLAMQGPQRTADRWGGQPTNLISGQPDFRY